MRDMWREPEDRSQGIEVAEARTVGLTEAAMSTFAPLDLDRLNLCRCPEVHMGRASTRQPDA
jgi:hypothetical protein